MAMNLPLLPPIEPEELLRSYLERTTLLNRSSMRAFGESVFGGRNRVADWVLPSWIGRYAATIGELLGQPAPAYWLLNHTLTPVFSSVLSKERRSRFIERLVEASSGPKRSHLGLTLEDWLAPSPRLCRACDDESRRSVGASVIRREWLAPFNTSCPMHGELLTEHRAWTPLTRGPATPLPIVSGRQRGGFEWARDVRTILRCRPNLLETLASLLATRGYRTSKGRYRRMALYDLVARYSKGRFQHSELDRLMSRPETLRRVLAPVGRTRDDLHPVVAWHLIKALQEEPEVMPQQALWELTPTCDDESAVAFGEQETATSVANRVGVSITTAVVVGLASGASLKLRPKRIYPDVRKAVEQQLAGGDSIDSIAAATGLSVVSVYRILKASPPTASERQEAIRRCKLAARRDAWGRLAASHPDIGVKALRQLQPALYALLYRNDRAWLAEQTAVLVRQPASASTKRRNRSPEAADRVLAHRIARTGGLGADPRLTQACALHRSGRGRRRFDANSFPRSARALEKATETLDEYVSRRLGQGVEKLRLDGLPAVEWRVVKASGLRPTTIERANQSPAKAIERARAARWNGEDDE